MKECTEKEFRKTYPVAYLKMKLRLASKADKRTRRAKE